MRNLMRYTALLGLSLLISISGLAEAPHAGDGAPERRREEASTRDSDTQLGYKLGQECFDSDFEADVPGGASCRNCCSQDRSHEGRGYSDSTTFIAGCIERCSALSGGKFGGQCAGPPLKVFADCKTCCAQPRGLTAIGV